MPKEIIHSRYEGTEVKVLGEDGSAVRTEVMVEPFLHVGWSKDAEHVELASRMGGDYADDHKRPGCFVQLDRSGINRLIRLLRKARDDAYGSDA